MNEPRQNLRVIRVVAVGWLLGWFIKIPFYAPYLLDLTQRYPLEHPLFPVFFEHPAVSQFGYFLPLIFFPALLSSNPAVYRGMAVAMGACSLILLGHINTCNDATFVTSFWTALWMSWFAWNMRRQDENFRWHACFLAQCLVGMIFLGGTLGKLTPEYWRGGVFYDIFSQRVRQWPFGEFFKTMGAAQQYLVLGGISKAVIGVEALLALAPLWPARLVCRWAPPLLLVVTFFSTWRILSVLSCLMALLWSCLALMPEEKPAASGRFFFKAQRIRSWFKK